jgi:hypothetical protein
VRHQHNIIKNDEYTKSTKLNENNSQQKNSGPENCKGGKNSLIHFGANRQNLQI